MDDIGEPPQEKARGHHRPIEEDEALVVVIWLPGDWVSIETFLRVEVCVVGRDIGLDFRPRILHRGGFDRCKLDGFANSDWHFLEAVDLMDAIAAFADVAILWQHDADVVTKFAEGDRKRVGDVC
ncbi:hypothetical protein HRbin20_01056 [bacterium HR20]|nr:hypothetical protein HRbin20_01056 [bacterium HR20]